MVIKGIQVVVIRLDEGDLNGELLFLLLFLLLLLLLLLLFSFFFSSFLSLTSLFFYFFYFYLFIFFPSFLSFYPQSLSSSVVFPVVKKNIYILFTDRKK